MRPVKTPVEKQPLLARIGSRRWLRFPLLAVLALTPFAIYAQSGLHVFVNGTVADANTMNENFTWIANIADLLDANIQALLAIPGQSCPPGELATGIDAAGALICAVAAGVGASSIVSAPLPQAPVLWGGTIMVPPCPTGSVVESVGARSTGGSGCVIFFTYGTPPLEFQAPSSFSGVGLGTSTGGCAGGANNQSQNCECFAVCRES